MGNFLTFSKNLRDSFGNDEKNYADFTSVLLDASNRTYSLFSAKEEDTIIRNQFDNIFCGKFKDMTQIKRMQVWRDHSREFASLIEETLHDKMQSGWNEANARFMDLVESKTIGVDDDLEFYVEDNSLMTVSKFAGNHHDINLNKNACLYSIRIA